VTRPDSDLLPRDGDAFLEALPAYRAVFRDAPDTFPLGPVLLDALAPAMREAIARGQKLTAAEVRAALDLPPPVPWHVGVR
jgi:hypothetical protein